MSDSDGPKQVDSPNYHHENDSTLPIRILVSLYQVDIDVEIGVKTSNANTGPDCVAVHSSGPDQKIWLKKIVIIRKGGQVRI